MLRPALHTVKKIWALAILMGLLIDWNSGKGGDSSRLDPPVKDSPSFSESWMTPPTLGCTILNVALGGMTTEGWLVCLCIGTD